MCVFARCSWCRSQVRSRVYTAAMCTPRGPIHHHRRTHVCPSVTKHQWFVPLRQCTAYVHRAGLTTPCAQQSRRPSLAGQQQRMSLRNQAGHHHSKTDRRRLTLRFSVSRPTMTALSAPGRLMMHPLLLAACAVTVQQKQHMQAHAPNLGRSSHSDNFSVIRPSARRAKGNKPDGAICVRNFCAQCVCNSHYLSQLAAFFIDPRAK